MRRLRLRVMLAMVSIALIMTACGGTKTKTVTVTSTVPGPTTTVTVTASPTPSPTTGDTSRVPLALGRTWTSAEATATVYAYTPDAATGAPPPQDPSRKWEAIDVKVCSAVGGSVSNQPWSLVGSEAGSYNPSSTGYNQFPEPQYPFGDRAVNKGECVRGWIVFDVLRTAVITKIRYSVQSSAGEPQIAYWRPR